MWGGPVPDAATALAVLLARLVDAQRRASRCRASRTTCPRSPRPSAPRSRALPFDAARSGATRACRPDAAFAGDAAHGVYERLWHRPALAVTGSRRCRSPAPRTSSSPRRARGSACASRRAGRRARARRCWSRSCERDPPLGRARRDAARSRRCRAGRRAPTGPAFDAARRALRAGFGREAVDDRLRRHDPVRRALRRRARRRARRCCSASRIPLCNAHGENESLHLGDFRARPARRRTCSTSSAARFQPRGRC